MASEHLLVKPAPEDQAAGQDVTTHLSRRERARVVLNSSLVALALLVLIGIFTATSPYFLTSTNLFRIGQQVAVVAVLAVGQAFVIITGGIDLSQAAVIPLAAVVGASVMGDQHSVLLGVLAGVGTGLGVGIVNGLLVTLLRLTPFIATLATFSAADGSALLLTGGQPVFSLPASFSTFGSGGLAGLPYIVLVAIVIALVFHFVLSITPFGRHVYAVGSNPLAARLAGLRNERLQLSVYALSGLMSGVGGLLLTAYVSTAQPSVALDSELDAIAAVVIGGASLFGGEGTIWGAMLGALLLTVLNNGTDLLGISTYVQTVLLGVVLAVAVAVDNVRRRAAA